MPVIWWPTRPAWGSVPATNAAAAAVEDCGRRGVHAVVLISSGLTGTPAGSRVLDAMRRYGMRLVGPNCLGVLSTDTDHPINVTFPRHLRP